MSGTIFLLHCSQRPYPFALQFSFPSTNKYRKKPRQTSRKEIVLCSSIKFSYTCKCQSFPLLHRPVPTAPPWCSFTVISVDTSINSSPKVTTPGAVIAPYHKIISKYPKVYTILIDEYKSNSGIGYSMELNEDISVYPILPTKIFSVLSAKPLQSN